jgi:hypothetical protein
MSEQPNLPTFGANDGSDIRKVWHNDEWYFSVVDVVAWATGRKSKQAKDYWRNLKAELKKAGNQSASSTCSFKMPAADGKMRSTDFSNAEQVLRVIQEIPGTKTNEIKDWLAAVGAERIEETTDPEGVEERLIIEDQPDSDAARLKRQERRIEQYRAMGRDDAWIAVREFGIITRLQFIAMIKELLGNRANYGQLTNDVYRGVHHRDTQELCADLGLKSGQNPRDHMHRIGLYYIGIAEEACQIKLQHLRDDEAVPPKLVREIIIIVSKQIGVQADELALALGIDLVTGKPLLPGQPNVYGALPGESRV